MKVNFNVWNLEHRHT